MRLRRKYIAPHWSCLTSRFAATHEREGAEIARQITSALLENNVTVFFVSHMYEFSRSFLEDDRALFLRADRGEEVRGAFSCVRAKPLPK